MLVVVGVVFLALKPHETRRLWPLVVPVLVATHFLLPGALGSVRHAFFPEEGLIAEQRDQGTNCDSGGRIADIGPTLDEVKKRPLLGYGYGTRIVTGPERNACILDNQWLGSLVELGVVGVFAWLWLFLSVLRRLGRGAKSDDSPGSWLLVAVTASVTAFAVGMASFDALGFVQVTFLLFILLALGAAAVEDDRSRMSDTGIGRIGRG
jgi:O-antigen ligase